VFVDPVVGDGDVGGLIEIEPLGSAGDELGVGVLFGSQVGAGATYL